MDWPSLCLGAVIGWAIGAACGAAGVILAIVQIYLTGARHVMRNSYEPSNVIPGPWRAKRPKWWAIAAFCGVVALIAAGATWLGHALADIEIPR